MEGVFDAGLFLFHLGLGRGTNVDDGDTAGKLGETFLELLAIVVGGGLFDLTADLSDPAGDRFLRTTAFNDRCVILVYRQTLDVTELVDRDILELDTEIFSDAGAAGQHGDVLKHLLATIAETRSLDSTDVERATQLVDNERGQGLAFDVFSDDQKRLALLRNILQQRQQVLQPADLLLVDENQAVLKRDSHAGLVGDEVRRQIALVKLHAFDDVEGRLNSLGFLDRDRTVLANLVHRVGNDLADRGVAVG